jgi:hypothetical protein
MNLDSLNRATDAYRDKQLDDYLDSRADDEDEDDEGVDDERVQWAKRKERGEGE